MGDTSAPCCAHFALCTNHICYATDQHCHQLPEYGDGQFAPLRHPHETLSVNQLSLVAAWRRLPQGLRYLLVGGINTAFGYTLFALCYLGLRGKLAHGFILAISHVLAVSFSFATHSHWVFFGAHTQGWCALLHAWWRFQLAYVGLFGLGFAVNMCMLHWIHPSVWLAQFVATGMCVAVGYTIHRWFVFRNF